MSKIIDDLSGDPPSSTCYLYLRHRPSSTTQRNTSTCRPNIQTQNSHPRWGPDDHLVDQMTGWEDNFKKRKLHMPIKMRGGIVTTIVLLQTLIKLGGSLLENGNWTKSWKCVTNVMAQCYRNHMDEIMKKHMCQQKNTKINIWVTGVL